MKKVLQITNYIYPAISGIGQTAKDIADILCECEIEQKIICFNINAKKENCETRQKETVIDIVDGIEVIRCGVFATLCSQAISLTTGKVIHTIINEFNPDIVIFHYPNPFMAFFLLQQRKKKFQLVLYWHSDIIKQKLLRQLFVRQNYKLLEKAWKIVATSPNYIEGSKYLLQEKRKCIVIPSCIREDRLIVTDAIKEKAKKIKHKGKIICFALGRHVAYKGFEYLIEASKYLDNRFEIIIGSDGALTKKLKKQSKNDKKIKFVGRLNESDLMAYYYACDIFCFPSISKNEAFGLALADAMFFAKPAVTFTIEGSGVNYVNLHRVTGIECENRNAKQYAKALLELANNKEERLEYGKSAKERVENNFLFKQFKENIKDLLCR